MVLWWRCRMWRWRTIQLVQGSAGGCWLGWPSSFWLTSLSLDGTSAFLIGVGISASISANDLVAPQIGLMSGEYSALIGGNNVSAADSMTSFRNPSFSLVPGIIGLGGEWNSCLCTTGLNETILPWSFGPGLQLYLPGGKLGGGVIGKGTSVGSFILTSNG